MDRVKLEALIKENPAAAAAAAMATVTLLNKDTGRKNKAITALRNKDNPSHGKAVGIFQRLRDKFKKKEDEPMSKADQYKAMTKQFAARTGKELRRNEMKITEDILRKVIREEIKNIIKEDEESFSQPIPAQIDRYMKKFIDAVGRGNLNRKRKLAILGRTIVALRLDPQEVSKYARLVKREL